METPPGPARVSRRLKEQFAPAYLATTGLVQVLVLDALIIRQFADQERDLPLALVAGHWYRAAMAVATIGLAGVAVTLASSVPMWNQILRYARGG